MRYTTTIFLAIAICGAFLDATAQKLELVPYGFIKGEAVYATKGVLSFGNANLVAPQIANGVDTGALGFTAQHSRFGFKGSVGDEDFTAGGLIEVDFLVAGFDINARSRLRQAYAWLSTGNFEVRFGQQWDLFSPNLPTTGNTNAVLWYAGNSGFRRGMFQLLYSLPMENVDAMIQVALCEGTREESGVGWDNWAKMPMMQGRLSAKLMKKYGIGASMVYAKHSPAPESDSLDFNSSGFGFDFDLPFHDLFALKGEVNMGTNLANASMFSVAGAHKPNLDKKNVGFWANATSRLHDHLTIVLGFGMDRNTTDEAMLARDDYKSNTVLYADIIVPLKYGFSITLEAESITTTVVTGMQNDAPVTEDRSAIVFNLSGKLAF